MFIHNRCIISDPVYQKYGAQNFIFQVCEIYLQRRVIFNLLDKGSVTNPFEPCCLRECAKPSFWNLNYLVAILTEMISGL